MNASVQSVATIDPRDIVQATHGSPDHPLVLGEARIPCYVLEDGRRVIVQGAMISALGMSQGTARAGIEGDRLVKFAATKALQDYFPDLLVAALRQPIIFRTAYRGDCSRIRGDGLGLHL